MIKHLILTITLLPFITWGQVSGTVFDSKTKEPLPFVNIGVNNSSYGTSSDIDGKFSIKYKVNSLQFSYVGYEPKTVAVSSTTPLKIYLDQRTTQLNEVVINPEENPALRIIRNVIENRKENDVEMRDYTCELYNKFTMHLLTDTSHPSYKQPTFENEYEWDPKQRKNVIKYKRTPEQIDSAKQSYYEELEYYNNTPMMLLETYVEKKHIAPDLDKELVTATKMSGFKNPSILSLLTKIQSFSFYNSEFALQGEPYLSPISKEGLKKYFYLIEDTIYDGADSVFVISYRPYKGKVFKGMKGVMQISSNKWALKNVTATEADTAKIISITINQLYRTDSNNQWEPYQLLGELSFPVDEYSGDQTKARSKTYITGFDDNTKVKRRDIDHLTYEITPKAHKVDSTEWSKLRTIPLTKGEAFTVVDSVSDSIPINLDTYLTGFKVLMTGKIPFYWTSIDLDRLISYNSFEGTRLGFGLHTNNRLSKYFNVGGYFAYGLKDKQWKYGGDLGVLLSKRRDIGLNFSYVNDVVASGKTEFLEEETSLLATSYEQLFYNRMDNIEKYQASMSFRAFKHATFNLFGNQQTRRVNDGYQFIPNSDITKTNEEQYNITEVGINVRYAYKEEFYFDGVDKFSMGTKYPIFYGKVTSGTVSADNNSENYLKYDLKLWDSFKIGSIGNSRLSIEGGLVDGNVPYTLLHNPDGAFKQFNISVNEGFETMRINEFLANQYVNIFYGHKFKPFNISKKFRPSIELVHNLTFGTLDKKDVHQNVAFQVADKGYFETGIRIHRIFKLQFTEFGFGTFYRYGPYSLPNLADNFAYKIVLGFGF